MPRFLDRSPRRRGNAFSVALVVLFCSTLVIAAACSHDWDLLDSRDACPPGQNVLCTSVPRWPGTGDDAGPGALVPDCLDNTTAGVNVAFGGSADAWAFIWAGWAEDGLHVVFDVTDPHPTPNPTAIYNGPAVEIYAKGDVDTHGPFGSSSILDVGDGGMLDPGATHLIVAAPSLDAAANPDAGALWFALFWGSYEFKPPAGVQVSSQPTTAGYRVEVLLPWNVLSSEDAGSVPEGGISLDFALDVGGLSPDAGRSAQLTFSQGKLQHGASPSSECEKYNLGEEPYCDDRVWCKPSLQP